MLDSVKADGSFTMLDNDVPATLNSDGKYMLLYTDGSTSAENTAQRERVLQLFEGVQSGQLKEKDDKRLCENGFSGEFPGRPFFFAPNP